MDDSQSSDIFSQNSVNLHNSTIDIESYDLLLAKIKDSAFINVGTKNSNSEHFNLILNDCRICIFQGFDIILSLLENSEVQIDRICGYIDDAACILQTLSNIIKNVIETVAITCCKMRKFPTSTGNIISLVFSHCKDSECIYGSYLRDVEKQLKALFRNCHELQLTYLMALGKNFLFNLLEIEEQNILLETLDINLKIGEVVQSLDVKTMAEQWKAYTMICEKYSHFLSDKNIYNNCTKLLVSTIEDNIKTALEVTEEKVLIRSLKVASFSLKILLRMSSIFKGSTCINYQYILNLLNNISLCNSNYYELTLNKTNIFTKLLSSNLSPPLDALITQLINEEKFLKLVLSSNISDIKEPNFLAHILLKIMIMKGILKKNEVLYDIKNKIIEDVFSFLPKCHQWFNIGLKFNSISNNNVKQFYGLYEYLLIHTISLAASMNCEEYNKLEKHMYKIIMGLDYYSAVFTANVWVSLCRIGDSQLHLNTLKNLLKIYQQLETNGSFTTSPQQVNLNYTIEMLFQTLQYPEKLLIYKHFSIQDNTNIGIWCAMKIRNLPENLEISAEKLVVYELIKIFDELSNNDEYNDVINLIKHMKLASTCSFIESDSKLEDLIVRSWSRACPNCNKFVLNNSIWFKYIETLTYLTDSYVENFENSANLTKILHVISSLLLKGNTSFLILLFKTFCKLFCHSQTEDSLDKNILINTLKALKIESDVQNYLFSVIESNDDINNFVTHILNKESSLGELRYNFDEYNTKLQDPIERKKQLENVSEYVFVHKCIENDKLDLNVENAETSSNFGLDLSLLFEAECEPASKKAKLDTSIENLLSNLEKDVLLLSQAKENILSDHKNRIKTVCDNLRNIIS
ncbi:unnamed protein product [Euphydryas editha]|uniref:Uncharacterized protein n=1 Tax=Euphydryas editha TaxID=104508 RepID=A0AAU9TUW7_EUPED|nr:unnamed protein product [Euphydryas editha]